jgi:hypothetical protein
LLSPPKYLEKLEARTVQLLDQQADPAPAMTMLAQAAIEGGLIPDNGAARQSSPVMFAGDLLTQNPAALDWVNAKREAESWPPHPDRIESLDEIASAFRPSPN